MNNYRTGIDCNLSGTEGTDYWEESLFHDPLVADWRVIYLRGATSVTFAHNARNVARVPGAGTAYAVIGVNGQDATPASGDEGIIRMRVDGDYNRLFAVWSAASGTMHPAYAGPFTFDALTYPAGPSGGGPVLGAVGSNGAPYIPEASRFNYGQLDQFGDEHHTITVADDDWQFLTTDTEWRSSDGKVYHFVVNPNTPCIKFTVTGAAQFYTTPIKAYRIPRVHALQTTYLWVPSGTVTVSLKSLSGDDTYYRINGGSWVSGSAPTLTHADFSTGSNTLEYYSAGSPSAVKTRYVIKNPTHPSLTETHGYLWSGSDENYTKILERIARSPYSYQWGRHVSGASDTASRNVWWNSMRRTGLRHMYSTGSGTPKPWQNAVVAKVLGATAVTNNPAAAKSAGVTYAQLAKEMLLEHPRTIDNVGFEQNTAQASIPTREIRYRGYYDVGADFQTAFAYDLLISFYRSDQVAGGITPIEDYYLRDCNAMTVMNALAAMQQDGNPGMWDTAIRLGAIACMLSIPSYSTPYLGTNGLDGTTTTYPDTPFPDHHETWKAALLDETATIRGYPNLAKGIGVEVWNCTSTGDFFDRSAYVGHMGGPMAILANTLKYNYPSKSFPFMEAFFLKSTNGTVMGLKDNSGPTQVLFLPMFNSSFPAIADVGIPIVQTAVNPDPASDDQLLNGSFISALAWYDDEYVPGSGSPLVAPYFTTQPVGAVRTEGESVTFTVVTTGNPTPTRQWRKDGANISGQTGTSYTIASTVVGDAGIYDCVATNSVAPSGVMSAAATLVVNAIPPTPDPVTKRTNYRTPAAALFAT